MNIFTKLKKSQVIYWLLVVLWLGIIYYLSQQPAAVSADLSRNFVRQIIKGYHQLFALNLDAKTLNLLVIQVHKLVRKAAHVFLYYTLGFLVIKAFLVDKAPQIKLVLLALLFCMGYAAIDEWHQTFAAGRSGEIQDVLLDSAAAFLGIITGILIRRNKC